MSQHYSIVNLNTYSVTPYFRAHVPEDYPLNLVLQKCRSFRKLPPRLRELSALAGRWARKNYPELYREVRRWYDRQGHELDPSTGDRLSEDEIASEWPWPEPDIEVTDIPAVEFADPDAWEEPIHEPPTEAEADDGLTEEQVLEDIASRGREDTAAQYGLPPEVTASATSDRALARAILQHRGQRHE